MPVDAALLAAGVSAAAGLTSAGVTAAGTNKLNKKTMKWNEKMYGIQRADALADLDRQNLYNSPEAQMARLKAAGLNPNLVYGNGQVQSEAAQPRGVEPKAWNPSTPDYSGIASVNPIAAYQSFQLQRAQLDNLNTINALKAVEKTLKLAQTANTMVKTDRAKIDVAQATDLYQISLDYAKEKLYNLQQDTDNKRITFDSILSNIGKTRADTKFTLDQNERAAIQNTYSIREAYERILTMQAQRAKTADERSEIQQRITNLKTDNEAKTWDNKLKAQGIQPHDNMWFRVLGEMLNMSTQKQFEGKIVDPVFPGIPRYRK